MTRRQLLLSSGALLAPSAPEPPTLWLIGDSTVHNGTKGQQGWGTALPAHWDPGTLRVVNRARGGRSSRTFLTEGLWEAVRVALRPGDLVLMQFGHNDGGEKFKGTRPRGSIRGDGEETETGVVEQTGKEETVHSYGWYLRRYAADTRAQGAIPIVCSPVPRNLWRDGKVARASGDYGRWAQEAARRSGAAFVDLNARVADRYDALGEEKVAAFFFGDHTHTSPEGAAFTARIVADAVREIRARRPAAPPQELAPPSPNTTAPCSR